MYWILRKIFRNLPTYSLEHKANISSQRRTGQAFSLGNREPYLSDISEIYSSRKEGEHVDHIIARVSKRKSEHIACGLHVPWNLSVIDAIDNMSKSSNIETNQTDFTQMVWLQTRLIDGTLPSLRNS